MIFTEVNPLVDEIAARVAAKNIVRGIVPAADLIQSHRALREPIIDGLLRRGETMNLIGKPKMGKSWLVLGLAAAITSGSRWLGHETKARRVLLIDAELHEETLANRVRRVYRTTASDNSRLDTKSIRGKQIDIHSLHTEICELYDKGDYDVIILDALYRLLPVGTSESDNAQMMLVYNKIDAIAKKMDAAVVIVHHTTKGNQSTLGVTDVGSGAGSISRAADTHLTIRPHKTEGLAVLDAVTRSFKPPTRRTIRFENKVWRLDAAEPVLEVGATRNDLKQDQGDQETKNAILRALTPRRVVTISALRKATGYGESRVRRGIRLLGSKVVHKAVPAKQKNQLTDAWRLRKVIVASA